MHPLLTNKITSSSMTETKLDMGMIIDDSNSDKVKQEPQETSNLVKALTVGTSDPWQRESLTVLPLLESQDIPGTLLEEPKEHNTEENNKTKIQSTLQRSFKCEICDKQYLQSGHLKRHKLTHIGLKPYGCDLCSKTFGDSSTLKKHRVIHTEERPFTCEVCKKAFSFNSTLKTHMRIHTGEKPYSCEICNRGFSDSSNLKAHLNIHKGKIYSCEVCNRGFSKISYLKMHMLKHNGPRLDCELCHKGFSYYGSLKRHIQRIHLAREPFSCEICQESINDVNTLEKHMLSHAGETEKALSQVSAA